MTEIIAAGPSFKKTWTAVVAFLCRSFDEDRQRFRFLLISQHQHVGEIAASLPSPIEVLRDLMAAARKNGEIAVDDPDFATAIGLGAVLQTATFVLYDQLEGPLERWADEIAARSLKALR